MTFKFRTEEGCECMEFKDMSRKLGLVLRAQAKAFADAERGKMLSPSMGCVWGGIFVVVVCCVCQI